MENLKKLYPIVPIMYGEDGISSSEAQRLKEELKNKSLILVSPLSYRDDKIYIIKRELLSANGVSSSVSELSETITPKDFDVLSEVADNNSKSAIYGFGLRFKDQMMNQISGMDHSLISEIFEITKPKFLAVEPTKHNAVMGGIDNFCQKDRIEDLYQLATKEFLGRIGPYYHKAMQIESNAAVYGNQVAQPNSFLRKLLASPETLQKRERSNSTFLVDETPILALKKEDFKELEENLMSIYTNAQKERNMFVKLIKDHARALQSEYDERYANQYQEFVNASEQYNKQLANWRAQCEKLRTTLLSEVAALKIIA